MAPRRGKATGAASEAEAAAPRVSAPRVKGVPTEPRESPAVPEAARPSARRCGPARPSGSRREKSGPDPQEKRQVRARAARAEDRVEGPPARTEGVMPPAAPGPPLPRRASRREGTARSARERRPQPGPTEVPEPLVPVPSLGRGKEAPGSWKPRAVLEKLRLSRQEISEAAEVVNRLTDHLLRRLQSCESEFKGVAQLRTGSYYERVKVSCAAPPLQFPRTPAVPAYPPPTRPSLPFGSNSDSCSFVVCDIAVLFRRPI